MHMLNDKKIEQCTDPFRAILDYAICHTFSTPYREMQNSFFLQHMAILMRPDSISSSALVNAQTKPELVKKNHEKLFEAIIHFSICCTVGSQDVFDREIIISLCIRYYQPAQPHFALKSHSPHRR